MTASVNVNGRVVDQDHAVVSVFDHGFLYGEGIYETLRTYNRVPFLFERHMARLRASAKHIQLDIPVDNDTLIAAIDKTVAAAGEMKEAYIRVLVTRGVGELTYDLKATPVSSLIIIVKPADEPSARITDEGIQISLVSILRNHPGSVNPVIKSNNLLNNALAMQEAHRRGGEEGLMCNYRGELSECSQSNFFMVRDGVVLTPKSAAGLLEGVTRAFLFEVGRDIGVTVRDETLYPRDLDTADEAFITSSIRGVVPIVAIDGAPLAVGPISARVRELYQAFLSACGAETLRTLDGREPWV